MIDDRADASPCRLRLTEHQDRAGNLDAGEAFAVQRDSVEVVDPELAVCFGVADVEVDVPHRHAELARRGELGECREGEGEDGRSEASHGQILGQGRRKVQRKLG